MKSNKDQIEMEYEKLDDRVLLDVLAQHVMDVGGAFMSTGKLQSSPDLFVQGRQKTSLKWSI